MKGAENAATAGPVVGAYGAYFATGIAYAITGGAADLDATAVAAGDVILNIGYA